MPSSIDLWTIVIIVSLAHSFFVINLLLVKKEHKRSEGKWLLFLLLCLFWFQLEFLSIRWPFDIGLDLFYGTRHGSWLLVGPLFYFYLKTLIGESVSIRDYGYLIPFFIFTIIIPVIQDDFLTFRQVHYGMLTPFDSRPDEINQWQYFYSFIFIGQFLYLAFFIVKSRQMIKAYQKTLKEHFADIDYDRLKWLNILWLGMLFILLLATLFLVLLFFTEIYRRHMDYLYVIPTPFLFMPFHISFLE